MERILKAFNASIDGLITTFEQEKSFREDVLIFALFFPLALFLDVAVVEKALLIFSLIFILITELANTAIETVVDRISLEKHPLSKMAKDVGSAMVMLALANAAILWSLIVLL